MHLLITYDITDTKRRNKIVTLLEGYGVRVNYSVFEVEIKPHKVNRLVEALKALMERDDSIRIYAFSADTIAKSYELNERRSDPFEKGSGYVE